MMSRAAPPHQFDLSEARADPRVRLVTDPAPGEPAGGSPSRPLYRPRAPSARMDPRSWAVTDWTSCSGPGDDGQVEEEDHPSASQQPKGGSAMDRRPPEPPLDPMVAFAMYHTHKTQADVRMTAPLSSPSGPAQQGEAEGVALAAMETMQLSEQKRTNLEKQHATEHQKTPRWVTESALENRRESFAWHSSSQISLYSVRPNGW